MRNINLDLPDEFIAELDQIANEASLAAGVRVSRSAVAKKSLKLGAKLFRDSQRNTERVDK